MAGLAFVRVKFRRKAHPTNRCAELAGLLGDGLEAARPAFPCDTEPELASRFEVSLRSRAEVREGAA